jgi:hypothetical protein
MGIGEDWTEVVVQGEKKIAFVSSFHGQRGEMRNRGAAVEKKKQSLHCRL